MSLPPRLTIRCATEDLGLEHWTAEGPVTGFATPADHKIVAKAAELFPESRDTAKAPAKISTVSPACYKLKIQRYRGAAYIDEHGQVWVVASGIREDGSKKDFYEQFMSMAPKDWLPGLKDYELVRRQRRRSTLASWEQQLRHRLKELDSSTEEDFHGRFPVYDPFIPSGSSDSPICTIVVEMVRVDGCCLGIEVRIADYIDASNEPLVKLSHRLVLSWIHRDEQKWSISPVHTSLEFDEECTAADVISGKYRAEAPLMFSPGQVAHYTHMAANDLWTATVEGTPINALCGRTFVPRQDHEKLEACPECVKLHSLLVQIR